MQRNRVDLPEPEAPIRGDGLVLMHHEVNPLEDLVVTVGLGDATDLEHGLWSNDAHRGPSASADPRARSVRHCMRSTILVSGTVMQR